MPCVRQMARGTGQPEQKSRWWTSILQEAQPSPTTGMPPEMARSIAPPQSREPQRLSLQVPRCRPMGQVRQHCLLTCRPGSSKPATVLQPPAAGSASAPPTLATRACWPSPGRNHPPKKPVYHSHCSAIQAIVVAAQCASGTAGERVTNWERSDLHPDNGRETKTRPLGSPIGMPKIATPATSTQNLRATMVAGQAT